MFVAINPYTSTGIYKHSNFVLASFVTFQLLDGTIIERKKQRGLLAGDL